MKGWIALGFIMGAAIAGAAPQLVVRIQPNADPFALARAYGITYTDRTRNAPFVLYTVPSNLNPATVQAELQADPGVVWAEDNIEVGTTEGQSALKGSTIPAIGGRSSMYAANKNLLTQINWSGALANSTGRTIRLAILDTGLSLNQRYLWTNVDYTANFINRFYLPHDGPDKTDSNHNGINDEGVGHGTMIAGIVDEIAPKVRLAIARIADSDGMATAWTIIEGLAFAVDSGCEVANMSFGSPNQIPALTDVMDWCDSEHLLVVSGIGNANVGDAFFPARINKVVCVTGLNPDNTKADFSNWDGGARSAAPATGIISQWWDGQMGTWSGTSFSSPMVAAAVADCLRRKPATISLNSLRDAVKSSGKDIDSINQAYRGRLGTLLDIQRLNVQIAP